MCKNGTFRFFYAKLYILLSVEGSTNHRNEIIWGEILNVKYGLHFFECAFKTFIVYSLSVGSRPRFRADERFLTDLQKVFRYRAV